jgi:Bacterial Ig-like domain
MARCLTLLLLLAACEEAPVLPATPDAAVIDATPTTIVSVSPADGATDVEPGAVVEVVFSRPVDGASILVTRDGGVEAGDLVVEGATVRFTPRRRLALLGRYQVTVAPIAQTIAFTVRDGTWGEAAALLGFDANSKDLVALAAGSEGALAISAARVSGGGYPDELWATRITDGALAEAEPIEADVDESIEGVDVAFDAAGTPTVVWTRENGSGVMEVVAVRSTSNGWETPVPLADDAFHGRVASDGGSGSIAVWLEASDLVGRHFDAGAGWGEPEPIEALAGGIDDLSLDDGVVAWTYVESSSQLDVWVNRYVPGSGWGEGRALDLAAADNANHPQVSVPFVVWGDDNQVWARQHEPGSGWLEPVRIGDHDDAGLPRMAADASGRAVAVWHRQGSAAYADLWASHFTPDAGWSVPVVIDSEDLGAAQDPVVVLDPHGNGAAVWRQKDGSGEGIWVNRWRAEGGWGEATRLADDAQGFASFHAAIDGQGQVYVAWENAAGEPMIRVLR